MTERLLKEYRQQNPLRRLSRTEARTIRTRPPYTDEAPIHF